MRLEVRTHVFAFVARLATGHPWLVLLFSAALAVAGAVYAARHLRLNANTDDLIAQDRDFMVRYRQFLKEFGDLEFIFVVVDTQPDEAKAKQAVDRLLERLAAIPGLREVHGRIEPDAQRRIATRAMPEKELGELALVAQAFPVLEAVAAEGGGEKAAPARVASEAARLLRQALSGGGAPEQAAGGAGDDGAGADGGGASDQGLSADPRLSDPRARAAAAGVFLLKTLVAASDPAAREQLSGLLPEGEEPVYLRSDTGRYLLIQILPDKDFGTLSVIDAPLRALRQAIAEVSLELPGVDIGLTGKPVLQADELATSNADMVRGAGLGLLCCALLLMVAMHSVARPLMAVAAFLAAFGWTYGWATLAVGQLNLLSSVFMLVLVAAGLDYGVHVIARYLEHRQRHPEDSIDAAVRAGSITAMRGNLTGALTSCAVFATALATSFQGLRELGVIAGGGLFLCVIAMSLVLPALLVLVERRRRRGVPPLAAAAGRFKLPIRHPGLTLGLIAALSAALSWGLWRVRFEDNLLNLQDPTLSSVRWERRLAAESSGNSWFGAVVVDDIQEIPSVVARAEARPSVGMVRSVLDVIALPTEQREALRTSLHRGTGAATGVAGETAVAPAEDAESDPLPWSASDLHEALSALRVLAAAAALRAPEESKELTELSVSLGKLVEELAPAGADHPLRERVEETVAGVASSVGEMLEGDRRGLRDALPGAVRDTSISPDGRLLVMVHPKENVWDAAHMGAFVDDLLAVSPDATGVPFTHYESLQDIEQAFVTMAVLSSALVALLVLIDFRRLMDVLLAMTPLALALLWTFELMGIFGITLNLANFFAIPILIGLGVDSAIHMLHRYHEGDRDRPGDRLNPGATRRAVILTNLTTSIGFAPLIFADHLGMRSLGVVMVLGNTACLASVLVGLPALLALREAWHARRGRAAT